MSNDFMKEMLKIENSIWKKLDKMKDIEIIHLNDFEMEKKNIQKTIIEKLGRVNLEEKIEYNFNLIFYRYLNKRKCLILGNNILNDEPILIKGKMLKILLFLLENFRNRGRSGFVISISNEHLELFLEQFNMTAQQFISNLERLKVVVEKDITNFSTYEDNENLILYNILLVESNCIKIYDIDDKVNILIFSNKLENDFKNSKMTQELEKKATEIIHQMKKLEEDTGTYKIDYVSILGVFVCVFTLISVNFNNTKEFITNPEYLKYFIWMETFLVGSLACILFLIRIFIYKDRSENFKIIFLIILFLVIGANSLF